MHPLSIYVQVGRGSRNDLFGIHTWKSFTCSQLSGSCPLFPGLSSHTRCILFTLASSLLSDDVFSIKLSLLVPTTRKPVSRALQTLIFTSFSESVKKILNRRTHPANLSSTRVGKCLRYFM